MSKTDLMLHTDAPIDLLEFTVGGLGTVAQGVAVGHGTAPDCVYGWAEPWDPEKACKPHHLVYDMDPRTMVSLADILIALGDYQVVVSERADWSIQPDGFPLAYDDDHQH